MDQLADILEESTTPGGTRDLDYRQMLSVLEAGRTAGLNLFSVDVTTVGQGRPLPEWMFRLLDDDLNTVLADSAASMALEFYRLHEADPDLANAWFRIFFDPLD